MRLKNKKQNKDDRIAFRVTTSDYNSLQTKANLYCEGNLSEYLIYAGLNFVPDKNDFEKPEQKKTGRK